MREQRAEARRPGVPRLARRDRARPRARARARDARVGDPLVRLRVGRGDRRRSAERGDRSHARGRPPRGPRPARRPASRARPRLPRRRRAARGGAHERDPGGARPPRRERGTRARRRRRPGGRHGAAARTARRRGDRVKLRLFHHRDGARVAYREAGSGPALVLLHSALLSHREWEPVAEHLTDRFRLVLPDLPLHGDSEDRPRHPYTLQWFAEVMAAFCVETAGPTPLVGGHDLGAEILLSAVETGELQPGKLVLMPNALHRPPAHAALRSAWRTVTRAAAVP